MILHIQEQRRGNMVNNNKLVFNYGAMGSGKSSDAINLWYSKIEDKFYTIVLKPIKDTKGDNTIVSRNGNSIKVDYLIREEDNIYYEICKHILDIPIDVIIVDEAQFLTKEQVEQLGDIVDSFGIDIVCYGLLTDFQGNLFEGSKRLIEIADDKIEIERQCSCGRKKGFNARFLDGEIVLEGEQLGIDGKINEKYEPCCRQCYKKFIREKRVNDRKK
jgi:thymidine kinase